MPKDEYRIERQWINGNRTVSLSAFRQDVSGTLHQKSTDIALAEALRPFLADLTIPQYEAVRLVFWEELSEYEAGEKLGISRDSVRDRLRDAYTKIRKAMVEAQVADAEQLDERGRFVASSQELVAPGFRKLMQSLKPQSRITAKGRPIHPEETARCIKCGRTLAQFRPGPLGEAPLLLGPECQH